MLIKNNFGWLEFPTESGKKFSGGCSHQNGLTEQSSTSFFSFGAFLTENHLLSL